MSKVFICISLKELSDIVVIYFMYDFTYLMQVKFAVSVKTPESLKLLTMNCLFIVELAKEQM